MLNDAQKAILRAIAVEMKKQNKATGETDVNWDRLSQSLRDSKAGNFTGDEICQAVRRLKDYGALALDIAGNMATRQDRVRLTPLATEILSEDD